MGAGLLPAENAQAQEAEAEALQLHTARFWHESGRTVVLGTFRVPLETLRAPGGTEADSAVYSVRLTVSDSAGVVLYGETWRQAVPAPVLSESGRGAGAAETFTFAVVPSRYTVQVEIQDSVSGSQLSTQGVVEGFTEPPPLSDLLAANRIRPLGEGESPEPGAVQKGSMAITTAGRVTIQPSDPMLYYYAEAYRPEAGDSADVQLKILDHEGKLIVATRAMKHRYPEKGGMETGKLDVRGLPPGDYRLVMRMESDDTVIERAAEFRMAATFADGPEPGPAPISERYREMSEAALDSLFGPLSYVITQSEREAYPGLTLEAKRRFMSEAFRRRDPTPGTARNEFEDEFHARVRSAGDGFRERGTAGRPGWATDRGRIYVKYGPPDEKFVSPVAGGGRAWEIWKYTRSRHNPYRYVFWDETGFENYILVFTDNRNEPSRPNWEGLVGTEVAEEIYRFF